VATLAEPLHVATTASAVDATFEIHAVRVRIVFHHKAGARNSPRSVNADYSRGLGAPAGALASVRASILGIAVDSGVARELDAADRELDLPLPDRPRREH
jgi:hypothetical protein